MAKSKERIYARKLRKLGMSIKDISEEIGVAKSTVSIWCRDIRLTNKQINKLHTQMVRGGYAGRMKGARMQMKRKQRNIEECYQNAVIEFKNFSSRELFILGIGLYWGEGSKSNGVRFANSDPGSVRVMMKWFRECLHVSEDRFFMYIGINEVHKDRLTEVIRYWSGITCVPIEQFRKPILIKAKNKKIYEEANTHYGTLSIRISKSFGMLYRILAWMRVLGEAG